MPLRLGGSFLLARCPTSDLRQRAGLRGAAPARLQDHPLPEAREYGQLMLHELRKVIPSSRRVDMLERGPVLVELPGDDSPADGRAGRLAVRRAARRAVADGLIGFDPQAEDKLLAAICYLHSHLPEHQLARLRRSASGGRAVGARGPTRASNRRHAPRASGAGRLSLRYRAARLRRIP